MPPAPDSRAEPPGLEQVAGSGRLAWSILESLPGVGFVVFDDELRVLAAGGEALRRRGYSAELITGRPLRDVLPASAFALFCPHYLAALTGKVTQLELPSADGEAIYESEFSPLRDARGDVIGGMVLSTDVTEARRSQAKLSESERQFRELATNATDLVMRMDLDSIVEFASPASQAILGIAPEDLVGRCFHDFVHPEDRAGLAANRRRVYGDADAPNDGIVRFEGRNRHADGSWIWTEATVRPIRDPSTGEAIGAQCAMRDISERREAEVALRVSERRMRLLLENLPDALVMKVDRNLVCRFVGGRALAASGLRPEDYVGRSLEEIYEPHGVRAAEMVGYNVAALAGETTEVVFRSEVTGRDFEIRILPLPGEDDEVVGTMIVASDVTEKLVRQNDLERLARIVAATGEAIVSCALDGQIDAVNQRACELFGYAEHELIGMNTALLLAPEERHRRHEARRAVADGEAWRGEGDHITRDGRRFPAAVTLSPVFDDAGAHVGRAMLISDTSEQRQAHQRLQEATKRFEQTIAHAPIGMALVAVDGSWLEVNRALWEIVGHDRDELMGTTFQDITHPEDRESDLTLRGEVLSGLRGSYEIEKRFIRKDGSLVWVLLTVSVVRDGEDRPLHFVSQILDISDRKAAADRLRHEADVDALTGVLNRRPFEDVVSTRIASARQDGRSSALLFVDLDGFKAVNDTHGHHIGDQILRAVADALTSRVRATDAVGRQGGDEFVVLLDHVDEREAEQVTEQLLMAIRRVEIATEAGIVRVDASIGRAMLDRTGHTTAYDAIAAADEAMYAVKASHR